MQLCRTPRPSPTCCCCHCCRHAAAVLAPNTAGSGDAPRRTAHRPGCSTHHHNHHDSEPAATAPSSQHPARRSPQLMLLAKLSGLAVRHNHLAAKRHSFLKPQNCVCAWLMPQGCAAVHSQCCRCSGSSSSKPVRLTGVVHMSTLSVSGSCTLPDSRPSSRLLSTAACI